MKRLDCIEYLEGGTEEADTLLHYEKTGHGFLRKLKFLMVNKNSNIITI